MLRKSLWLIVVAMTAGCTNPGVKNSTAFATSLNELTKGEVLSNLRRVYDEGATFVPSHVVVSTGSEHNERFGNAEFYPSSGAGLQQHLHSYW